MRAKRYLLVLSASLLVLSFAPAVSAQMTWFPIGGIPVGVPTTTMPVTPVAPPPPNMMPPAPPPPGNTFMGTGGISEYGSTISGGTMLATGGTDFMGGPAMSMPESPMLAPPYAPVETQTDEVLRSLYPGRSVRVTPAGRSYTGLPAGGVKASPAPGPSGPGMAATPGSTGVPSAITSEAGGTRSAPREPLASPVTTGKE